MTMKYSSLLVIVACLLPQTQARLTFQEFLALFIRPYRKFVVTRLCNDLLENYNDGYGLGCKCEGNFNTSRGGRLVCQNDVIHCLINRPAEVFCGELDFQVDFTAVQGPTLVQGCVLVQNNIPQDLTAGDFPPVCATAVPTGRNLTFSSCEVTWGNETCQSCTVCSSKRDFKYDCSNVNINPSQIPGDIFVDGPKTDTCLGFGFITPSSSAV